jgi:AcrR family transcriptional regulator
MARAGLTRERIVAEAATVADEAGLERLTLAAVAKRCGVSLPGLYKHIDGLEAVKRDIAMLAVGELTGVLATATAGLTGRAALYALTVAHRDYARTYPGRYAASVRAPAPGDEEHAEAAVQAIAIIGRALQGYDLREADLVHAVRLWRINCHGLVSLEAAAAFALAESMDTTLDRLIDALDHAFRTARR